MSGVTDYAFRELIKDTCEGEMSLLVCEFVSVEALTRKNPKTTQLMKFTESQRPYMVQIFGGNVSRMAEAAKMVQDYGVDFIELNCGCPAPKVVKKSGGSALLKDLSHLRSVIAEIVKSVSIPVSMKVRIGYTEDTINVLDTLEVAEGEGCSLFVVHGRTREQGYKGFSNWETIAQVKQKAKIPVIGNGDLVSAEQIVERIQKYGVDGASVGRGALHNPWIFQQIKQMYRGEPIQIPTVADHLELLGKYRDLLYTDCPIEQFVMGRLKQLAARMVKGFPGSAQYRQQILQTQTLVEFFDKCQEFLTKQENQTWNVHGIRSLNGKPGDEVEFGIQYRSR